MTVKEGMLDARGKRFGIVLGRFNSLITERLLEGALDCIVRHNGDRDAVEVVRVPGAVEMNFAAARMVEDGGCDAVICLGVVIRGSTPHFDYVASQIARGVAQLNLSGKTPVSFGVITADSIEQATERAGSKMGDKGWDAAMTAIEMADLAARMRGKRAR